MRLGCHVSISGGFASCARRALNLGCEAFQFFTSNPRSYKGKAPDAADGAVGVAFCREHALVAVGHAPYILNLSTPDAELHRTTVGVLVRDLQTAEVYGACGLVVHMGRHVGQGEEEGIARMVATLDEILEQYHGPVPLLLENTAGQGSELGTTLEQCLRTRAAARAPERIGFCFDTCHAFAAGLYGATNWDALAVEMERSGYRQHLVAVHLNDSKVASGARRDRHANIGKGEIGVSGISTILRSSAFIHLPVVLETPVNDESEYEAELAYTRSLYA